MSVLAEPHILVYGQYSYVYVDTQYTFNIEEVV